ncbi:MAG: repeat protein [Myxococcaceae bacterium]|nr:repeat protein [Myxococcaceae bacterium]
MQHSAHIGSGRRQDRVPLAVGIDLRGVEPGRPEASAGARPAEQGRALTLAADGLNVSVGGIAMRAAFVPPLGALLECSFACPPSGDVVSAQGEVVWSERCGPDEGQFGLRFVELDTKSATALRRFITPVALHEAAPERRAEGHVKASLIIDGLETTVEAELKLADDSRIVLEHKLSFLQLGRGVEVSVPGRGKERGRIASVELRHSHFDVPTLVYGVLLDEAPERSASERAQNERFEEAASKLAPLFSTPVLTPAPPAELPPVSALISARMRERVAEARREREREAERGDGPDQERASRSELEGELESEHDGELAGEPRGDELPGEPTRKAHVELLGALRGDVSELRPVLLPESAAESAPAMCVEDGEVEAEPAVALLRGSEGEPEPADGAPEGEPLEGALLDGEPLDGEPLEGESLEGESLDDEPLEEDAHASASGRGMRLDAGPAGALAGLRLRNLPEQLRALFRGPVARLHGLRERIEPTLREQAEYFDLPDAKSRFLLQLARLRTLLLQSWSKVRRSTARSGTRSPRTLRHQRSTLLGLGPAGETERSEPSKRARSIAIAFAVLGVALGVYALAPRSGADRIKLPERVQGQNEPAAAEPTLVQDDELDLGDEPAPALDPVPEPKRKRDRAAARAAAIDPTALDAPSAAAPTPPALSAPFGEVDVPNGRVFTLRMNGPVQLVEGEARENGITVRIPGRQALDRASPIATSHSAVQRAMILNRGGFAELTIDFVPGMTPKYQVRGKDNTLEVTLERL